MIKKSAVVMDEDLLMDKLAELQRRVRELEMDVQALRDQRHGIERGVEDLGVTIKNYVDKEMKSYVRWSDIGQVMEDRMTHQTAQPATGSDEQRLLERKVESLEDVVENLYQDLAALRRELGDKTSEEDGFEEVDWSRKAPAIEVADPEPPPAPSPAPAPPPAEAVPPAEVMAPPPKTAPASPTTAILYAESPQNGFFNRLHTEHKPQRTLYIINRASHGSEAEYTLINTPDNLRFAFMYTESLREAANLMGSGTPTRFDRIHMQPGRVQRDSDIYRITQKMTLHWEE